MESSSDSKPNDLCPTCGHDFDPHLIKGYGEPPIEGWIECPEEGCDCYMTWSLGDKPQTEKV